MMMQPRDPDAHARLEALVRALHRSPCRDLAEEVANVAGEMGDEYERVHWAATHMLEHWPSPEQVAASLAQPTPEHVSVEPPAWWAERKRKLESDAAGEARPPRRRGEAFPGEGHVRMPRELAQQLAAEREAAEAKAEAEKTGEPEQKPVVDAKPDDDQGAVECTDAAGCG